MARRHPPYMHPRIGSIHHLKASVLCSSGDQADLLDAGFKQHVQVVRSNGKTMTRAGGRLTCCSEALPASDMAIFIYGPVACTGVCLSNVVPGTGYTPIEWRASRHRATHALEYGQDSSRTNPVEKRVALQMIWRFLDFYHPALPASIATGHRYAPPLAAFLEGRTSVMVFQGMTRRCTAWRG